MRVVIHVGMPKTGSSSIQTAYKGKVGETFEYGDLPARNHSAALAMIHDDEDRLVEYPGFWPKGEAFMQSLPRLREVAKARLDAQMDRLRGTDRTLLLSAEALWSARRDKVRERLAAEVSRRGGTSEGIAYIRPPLSYAVSSFQQRLKGPKPPRSLSLDGFWPSYRKSIESLDEVFGRDRVSLRIFERSALAGGDVVEDFGQAVGAPLPRPDGGWPRTNETLSVEATAFLYAQRRGGLDFPNGFPAAMTRIRELIKDLRRIGTRRFTFDPALFEQAISDRRTEIEWTEARLGHSLAERPDPKALVIRSEDDLLQLGREVAGHDAAQEFLAGIEKLAREAPHGGTPPATRPDIAARRALRQREREARATARPASRRQV